MNIINKIKGWLLPTALILFLLEIILFPFVIQLAYAGRSENPEHVLTYTTNRLTWDSATGVDPDTGAAELSLFSSSYRNAVAENGEKIVAPGTQGTSIIRLKNAADKPITYIAVMYHIKEEDALPVEPVLAESDTFARTDTYPLPEDVAPEQVVQAVSGSLEAGRIQDFDISWLWNYYESDARDAVDTELGNRAAWQTADDVTVGLYIVVEEDTSTTTDPGAPGDPAGPDEPDGSGTPHESGTAGQTEDAGTAGTRYTYPYLPQTGDPGNLTLYLVLLAVSSVLFVLLLLERRKEPQ